MVETYQPDDLEKAAQRGEPSYVWRAGQERRLGMIIKHGGGSIRGRLLVVGCGNGQYLSRLAPAAKMAVGLDVEFSRMLKAKENNERVVCAVGEHLPFPDAEFTAVLSNEVIEHVEDDQLAVNEAERVLAKNGEMILFCPNKGYPFETHGMYWRGEYQFGNKFLVNYLPGFIRDRLAPHVRVYTRRSLGKLFSGLPLRAEFKTTVFGAYDNIIERSPFFGRILRSIVYFFEKTPLKRMGLSHFWILRKQ
jgi:SAM-dependent methyltransferase